MQNKNYLLYTLLIFIIVFLLILIIRNIKNKDELDTVISNNQIRINKLLSDIKNSNELIDDLQNEIKCLNSRNNEIDSETEIENTRIDSLINQDSSNAIKEYRKAITLFNFGIDNTDFLTFREIGIGAKLINSGYGMQLKINNYEQIVNKYEIINNEYEKEINNYKGIIKLKDEDIGYWEEKYKHTQSFWYNRFVIVAGINTGYTGNRFETAIGITIGIKLWGNN